MSYRQKGLSLTQKNGACNKRPAKANTLTAQGNALGSDR